MKRAWYLDISIDQVSPRAVLVGDPKRIDRLAELLDDVHWLGERRGLRTISGSWKGVRVVASAFGMGGPIATIVLHELFDLGARSFLRVGTAMTLPPVELGDFVVSTDALCRDGTSQAYVGVRGTVSADGELRASLERVLAASNRVWHRSRFASYDAFYKDMFALDPADDARVAETRNFLTCRGVQAIDMESAALFAAACSLGARAATFCVASVDNVSRAKLDAKTMCIREGELFRLGLDALTGTSIDLEEVTA